MRQGRRCAAGSLWPYDPAHAKAPAREAENSRDCDEAALRRRAKAWHDELMLAQMAERFGCHISTIAKKLARLRKAGVLPPSTPVHSGRAGASGLALANAPEPTHTHRNDRRANWADFGSEKICPRAQTLYSSGCSLMAPRSSIMSSLSLHSCHCAGRASIASIAYANALHKTVCSRSVTFIRILRIITSVDCFDLGEIFCAGLAFFGECGRANIVQASFKFPIGGARQIGAVAELETLKRGCNQYTKGGNVPIGISSKTPAKSRADETPAIPFEFVGSAAFGFDGNG